MRSLNSSNEIKESLNGTKKESTKMSMVMNRNKSTLM